MASIYGLGWDVWKKIQEISPRGIEDEANNGFKVALIGRPEDRARVKSAFLTDSATLVEREDAEAHLREFDEAPDADTTRTFAFTIYVSESEEEAIGARGANSIPITAPNLAKLAEAMIAQQPGLAVALGKRFPFFRQAASDRVIRDASRVNAQIAIISSLPGVFPPAAIILPASSMADVFLLTKNQLMMVMRLAAIYGRKPAYTKQIKEVIGVGGAAFGWRTLARELSGLIPGGFGVALKAAIAYSGTVAAGKAALLYYKTGRKATPAEVQQAYKESEEEAKREVAGLQEELKEEVEAEEPAPAPIRAEA